MELSTPTPNDQQATAARKTRTVTPPSPIIPPGARVPASSVVSVQVAHGEEVEWTWTTFPDGAQAVTGYMIRRAPEPATAA